MCSLLSMAVRDADQYSCSTVVFNLSSSRYTYLPFTTLRRYSASTYVLFYVLRQGKPDAGRAAAVLGTRERHCSLRTRLGASWRTASESRLPP